MASSHSSLSMLLLLLTMFLLPLHIRYSLVCAYSSPVQPMLCHAGESSALLQFKESFVIDKSASSDPLAYPKVHSWTRHSDCCSWDGVECDDENDGHVIVLDLTSSCLYGSINSSSSLFRLKHLQELSLADNHFNYSQIPAELGNLSTTLTYLDLSASCFVGQIPSEISRLSKLSVLNLISNFDSSERSFLQLKKSIFTSLIQNLTNLESLQLSWVDISSTVPNTLSNLSSLATLYLRSCNLTGEFPSSVFFLPNLRFLTIRQNFQLTGHFPRFNSSSLQLFKLGRTSFSGELPPDSIQNLRSLEEFDIDKCNFSGPIPSSFGYLTNLTLLDLSFNNFTVGNLSWLAHLTDLQSLSFVGLNLSSEIPYSFSSLTKLEFLYSSSCQLTGHIPSWIGNLTRLIWLDLQMNFLEGPVPSLSKLVNLHVLLIRENNLSGALEFGMFHGMRNLATLDLRNNNLSVVDYYGTLPNLDAINLGSCNLNKFPYFLKHQQKLRILSLASNNIHGQVPSWFCNISKETLLSLDVSNNSLTSFDQCNVANLSWVNLQFLDLSQNKLKGPLPVPSPSISYYVIRNNRLTGEVSSLFCDLNSLFILDLSHNELSGELPRCVGNLSHLSMLYLKGNSFSGIIPHMCTNGSSRLEALDLSENQLEGMLPRSLANCSKLRRLDVGQNHINDTFPFWMGRLDGLQLLILRSNRFHGVIQGLDSTANTGFPNLSIIDVSRNGFSGPLPSAFFQGLKSMEKRIQLHFAYMEADKTFYPPLSNDPLAIDIFSMFLVNKGTELEYVKIPDGFAAISFSSNNFSGVIPEYIGNLNGLYMLNLSNNYLTGCIPSSFANLTVLESLDLSHNMLSGQIPQELAQLTSLAVLDLSHNNLTGRIPRGNQFETFLCSSFDGNLGLWGDLLSTKRCKGYALQPPSQVPISSENYEDVESSFPSKSDWIVAAMGYAGGLVVGFVIGNELMARKPEWLVRVFGRKMQPLTRNGRFMLNSG